jgi:tetratricopeptide (TPR) repeat protein
MKNWLSKYHIALLIFSFGIYIQTASFDFVLDDKIVITSNQITKRGFEGVALHFQHDAMDGFWAEQYNVPIEQYETRTLVSGGRYRPLTLTSHSVEYELFGDDPAIPHLINALLYALLCVVLYVVLLRLFPSYKESWFSVPFLLTMLFAAHPLHVEVVANIKGRDEILSFLFAAIPLAMVLKDEFKLFTSQFWIAIFLFFLSLLSKETTIPFVLLIPMAYLYKHKPLKDSLILFAGFLGVALVYLFIRTQALGAVESAEITELMNNPLVNASTSEKWGVVFLSMFAYLKLMLIPNPLTHDYYPFHLPFMSADATYPDITHWASLLGMVAILSLGILMLIGSKNKQNWSYGLWFFFGTIVLVSNAIFPVGVFMNERFMFIPSFGLLIASVGLIEKVKQQQLVSYALLGVIVVFAGLSINRSFAWETDESLALTDVEVSIGSAKNQMAAGDALLQMAKEENNQQQKQEYLTQAFQHLKTSLSIYPNYFPPYDLLANVYFESGNYIESAKFFKQCAERKPENPKFLENIVIVANRLISKERYQEADQVLQLALELNPNYINALDKIAEVNGRYLNDLPKSIQYLERAEAIAPNNSSILQKMGVAYAMLGNTQNAIIYFEKVVTIDPNNGPALKNLGIAYIQIGDQQKGNQYIQRAEQLEQ